MTAGCRRGSAENGSAVALVAAVFVPAAVLALALPAWRGVLVAALVALVVAAYVAVGVLVALGGRRARRRVPAQPAPAPAAFAPRARAARSGGAGRDVNERRAA